MTVSWRSWSKLFCICLSLCATGALSEEFQLKPFNSTVLQGSDVQFNATVTGKWEVMTWDVGGLLVVSVSTLTGNITSSSDKFSARLDLTGDTSLVEFTIHNVTRNESGSVICSVLGPYGSKEAQLNVQESGMVNITGGDVTAAHGQQVEFQCVTSAWFPKPTVGWTRNGEAVNSSLYNTTIMDDGNSFNSTSILNFQAVSNTTVECWATVSELKNPESSSVFLAVVPKPTDWTVLIAVVVSFGSFALLVLLILGIIFCYKHQKQKETTYQEEMSRRVKTQTEISDANGVGQTQGQMNAGYVPEGQTSVPPSEHSDSGFSQARGSSIFEMPDVVNSSQAGNGSGIRKHRHQTIV